MTKPIKTYLDETLEQKLKELRAYEVDTYVKWGNRKRIFKIVGVNFEIKFCRAEQMLKESLQNDAVQKKLKMVEMMIRAFEQLNIKCEESGYIQIQPNARCFNFDNKTALICDTDADKPVLEKIHKDEKDMVIFSVEELLRCLPKDFMQAKVLLSKLDKSVNFQKVVFEKDKNKIKKEHSVDKKSYQYQVQENLNNFVKITLTDNDINKVYEFAENWVKEKAKEMHHQSDPNARKKRIITGHSGELAVEKYLNKKFIDWTVGKSKNYTGSDLSKLGLKLGVKTSLRGKYVLVAKKSNESQIIVIKDYNQKDFYICGVADKSILNKYTDDSFVIDENAKKRKTAFYGYRYLKPINKLKEFLENV